MVRLSSCTTCPNGLPLTAGLAAAVVGLWWMAPWAARAQGAEAPMSIPLQCRLGQGAWQPCAMEVERPGERWSLVVGQRRIAFRHDGRGGVSIDETASAPGREGPAGDSRWRPVQATWIAGPALCWNGICAQGDIPLD